MKAATLICLELTILKYLWMECEEESGRGKTYPSTCSFNHVAIF